MKGQSLEGRIKRRNQGSGLYSRLLISTHFHQTYTFFKPDGGKVYMINP